MNYYYDFHLHSCLSPCGDNDMTPNNIVNMAKILGFDIIALTDHNSCQNCRAVMAVGEKAGLSVVPGMELCTAEEVHIVCLFSEIDNAERFSDYVLSTVPPIKNRPEIFGNQYITDENDNITGEQEILLTTASGISIDNAVDIVESYGGVCYPAHINRGSYSVISNLGMITPEMKFNAVEITAKADIGKYKSQFPIINKMKIFTGSDAHYLENMIEPKYQLDIPTPTAENVINYIKCLH